MAKQIFAKGVSKVIPIIGGFASGSITFATMRPMGKRLIACLDKARFDYDKKDLERDLEEINRVINKEKVKEAKAKKNERKKAGTEPHAQEESRAADNQSGFDCAEELKRAKLLHAEGILSDEEYAKLKDKIISKL